MRFFAALLLTLITCAAYGFRQEEIREKNLRDHVYYLASDDLEGRGTNSKGYAEAAKYASEHFEQFGLKKLTEKEGMKSYYQTFLLSKSFTFRIQSEQAFDPAYSANVIGMVEGTDPTLKDEYIVLSAHLDHIGKIKGVIHNGANDNATGSAMMLELARVIAARPLKRSVIIALFGAEEIGLVGSRFFVDDSPVPLKQIVANLNVDGVGAYVNQEDGQVKLLAMGADATCTELLRRLNEVNAATERLELETADPANLLRRSDQFNFHQKGIPVVMFTDYGNGHYHKPTDDAHRLQYGKLQRLSNFIHRLTEDLGNRVGLCR